MGSSEWLRAGQAMERLLLTAKARGISAMPFVPLLRSAGAWQVIRERTGIEHPQMILRFGYAPAPPDHRTELLTIALTDAPIVPRQAVPTSQEERAAAEATGLGRGKLPGSHYV
jgi:hypothetical protein